MIMNDTSRQVGRFVLRDVSGDFLTDSLTGILRDDIDVDREKTVALKEKYELCPMEECQ